MSLSECARLYDIIGFCGKILFKYGWFLIKYQFLDNICFTFGIAGLNSVTKGSIFSSFLYFFFDAALLLSNLTSARISHFGFLYILVFAGSPQFGIRVCFHLSLSVEI